MPREQAALEGATYAADPDEALQRAHEAARDDAGRCGRSASTRAAWRALWALLGASTGFGEDFFFRASRTRSPNFATPD